MTIWRMRITCWIPNTTGTHSEYVILTVFQVKYDNANAPHCYVIHTFYVSGICHCLQMTIWCAGLDETCTPNGHLYTATYARCRIDKINSPGDGHMAAPKHVENRNKHI